MPMERSGRTRWTKTSAYSWSTGAQGSRRGFICGLPGDGVSVLGPVADATAALNALQQEPINLVLADLDRPDDEGVEIVRRIRAEAERTRVIGVTVQRGPDLAAGALAAGACGVVTPEPGGESLVSMFRRALAGELILPAIHLSNLVDRLRDGRESSTVCKLEFLTTARAGDSSCAGRRRVDRGDLAASAGDSPDDGAEPCEEHPRQAGCALQGRSGHAGVALRAGMCDPERVIHRG